MRRKLRTPALFVLIGSVLLLSACTRQKATEQIEGTVLDAAGKPRDKVRIFNRGDGLPPVETRTAADGHFCLHDFGAGCVWLFVGKEGYRFAAVRPKAGATDVRLTLVESREPPPARAAASEPTPLGEQQRLAHRLLEKLWGGGALGNRCYWLSNAMSRIDPELALRWAIDGKGDCADFIRAAMAEQIADKDFDEALGLLAQSGGDGLNALIRLARRYAASDPAKALRCIEELVVAGRAVDQPWRPGYLAEAGALAVRLGNKDAGRKLLDEAGTMAANLGLAQAHAGARGMVAAALAPSDLKRALQLVELIGADDGRDQFRANVAVAVCLQNPDQALAIAGELREPFSADRARLRVAIHLAPTCPADAVRVAEMVANDRHNHPDAGEKVKSTAFAGVAAAMGPRDKLLAWSLIDRALATLMAHGEPDASLAIDGGWPGGAGFVAIEARQIGYPDMESVVRRVLACRPSKKGRPGIRDASDMHVLESEIILATFLGLVDPWTAKKILQSVDEQSGLIRLAANPPLRLRWIKAWLVVDPMRGEALFAELANSIKGKPGKDDEYYGLVEAADLLASPLAEKAPYILPYYHDPDVGW